MSPTQTVYKQPIHGKNAAARRKDMDAGIAFLQQFLEDVISNGIGDPSLREYDFWATHAKRMVDAKLPGLGRMMREVGSLDQQRNDWAEQVILKLGKIYLAAQAYTRFDTLSVEQQFDLRDVLGWSIRKDEFANETEPINDIWMVMGSIVFGSDEVATQNVWLYGTMYENLALIVEHVYGRQVFELPGQVGTVVSGAAVYYPSAYPIRALFTDMRIFDFDYHLNLDRLPNNYPYFADLLKAHAKAISLNPWLTYYPASINNTRPIRHASYRWQLIDRHGDAVNVNPFDDYHVLKFIDPTEELDIFGVWQAHYYRPMSARSYKGALADLEVSGLV